MSWNKEIIEKRIESLKNNRFYYSRVSDRWISDKTLVTVLNTVGPFINHDHHKVNNVMGKHPIWKLYYEAYGHKESVCGMIHRQQYGTRRPPTYYYYLKSTLSKFIDQPDIDDTWQDEIENKQAQIIKSLSDKPPPTTRATSPAMTVPPAVTSPDHGSNIAKQNQIRQITIDNDNDVSNGIVINKVASRDDNNNQQEDASNNKSHPSESNANRNYDDDTITTRSNKYKRRELKNDDKHVECPGFTGSTYYRMIKLSTIDAIRMSKDDTIQTKCDTSYPLSPVAQNKKGYNDMHVVATLPKNKSKRKRNDNDPSNNILFSIRSKKCLKTYVMYKKSDRRCSECRLLTDDVRHICMGINSNNVDNVGEKYGKGKLDTKFFTVASPDVAERKVKKIFQQKKNMITSLRRKIDKLQEKIELDTNAISNRK